MWCLKCQHTDEECTCENTLARLQEKYEEGLGLLAQQQIRERAIRAVVRSASKRTVAK